ncbi:MAG: thiamine phosphate synthase [Bacteroidetes bacterium]|nr:thiamine phosphate synthase [Bacteroidota bacterium]
MISRFHFITHEAERFSHVDLAEFACKGGGDWIQLRVKGKNYMEWKIIAENIKSVCRKYSAKLIINDNVRIAREIGADGVHLGKEDMDPAEARKILGENSIIGGSANTAGDALRLIEQGVDYIGAGPYRFTTTKEKINSVIGIKGVRQIVEASGDRVPVIAIGGIQPEDAPVLLEAGVYGVAVCSAIANSVDKTGMTQIFLNTIYSSLPDSNREKK